MACGPSVRFFGRSSCRSATGHGGRSAVGARAPPACAPGTGPARCPMMGFRPVTDPGNRRRDGKTACRSFTRNRANGGRAPGPTHAVLSTHVCISERRPKRDKPKAGFARGSWHRNFQRPWPAGCRWRKRPFLALASFRRTRTGCCRTIASVDRFEPRATDAAKRTNGRARALTRFSCGR